MQHKNKTSLIQKFADLHGNSNSNSSLKRPSEAACRVRHTKFLQMSLYSASFQLHLLFHALAYRTACRSGSLPNPSSQREPGQHHHADYARVKRCRSTRQAGINGAKATDRDKFNVALLTISLRLVPPRRTAPKRHKPPPPPSPLRSQAVRPPSASRTYCSAMREEEAHVPGLRESPARWAAAGTGHPGSRPPSRPRYRRHPPAGCRSPACPAPRGRRRRLPTPRSPAPVAAHRESRQLPSCRARQLRLGRAVLSGRAAADLPPLSGRVVGGGDRQQASKHTHTQTHTRAHIHAPHAAPPGPAQLRYLLSCAHIPRSLLTPPPRPPCSLFPPARKTDPGNATQPQYPLSTYPKFPRSPRRQRPSRCRRSSGTVTAAAQPRGRGGTVRGPSRAPARRPPAPTCALPRRSSPRSFGGDCAATLWRVAVTPPPQAKPARQGRSGDRLPVRSPSAAAGRARAASLHLGVPGERPARISGLQQQSLLPSASSPKEVGLQLVFGNPP